MNKKYFIDIINSFIDGSIYKAPLDIDWYEIKKLADIHNMAGMVGVVVNRSNIKMPIECYEYFDYMVFDCARAAILWEMRFKEVNTILNNEKIDHIIVKGYVLRNLYPEKDMRTMGDLDFVLPKNEIKRASDALEKSGYSLKSVYRDDWSLTKDNMTIELHPGLMDADVGLIDYESYMSDIFEKTINIESHLFELNKEFHYIYQIMHIMKHFYDVGVGIRMILDIALYTERYKNELNWDYINNELKKLKITLFNENILAFSYRLFNKGIYYNIDDELFNEMFNYVMSGGTFGFARANSLSTRGRDRLAKKESALKSLIKRAFPSDNAMRGLILWYRNKPVILLPVAWVYRWINSAVTKKGDLAKSVIGETIIDEESKKELELLKKMGLYRR